MYILKGVIISGVMMVTLASGAVLATLDRGIADILLPADRTHVLLLP